MQKVKILILGVAVALAAVMNAAEPRELVDLRAKFDKAMDRATEALTIFWPSYMHQLEELKAKAQAQGNLEGVLAVETEMKLADKKSIGSNSKYAPLKSLQAEYAGLRPDLEKQIAPEKKRLYDIYYAALQSLEVSLTKERRLDDAVAVRNESEKLKSLAASAVVTKDAAAKPGGPTPSPQAGEGNYGVTNVVGHLGGGKPYRDVGADEAVLVGFNIVLAAHKDSKETVRGVTPIFRGKKGEIEGLPHGAQKGASAKRVVAKPGYAVGKVTIEWSGLAIHRIKLSFNRIDGHSLKTNDGYEGDWVGLDPEAKEEEVIDLKGKLPVGITGGAGLGFDNMAILFLDH